MANDKYVDILYQYFKNREDNEINNELKDLHKDELIELVLNNIKGENTEKSLMCQIHVFKRNGVKFNNEVIELANLYLNRHQQGDDLISVLKILIEAYINEYEIEKALEICQVLHLHEYDYIHSYYCECLYKLN